LEEIRAAIANGVVKVNVDTDMQYAFTHAIAEHFGGRDDRGRDALGAIDKKIHDPRAWGRKAERAMAARVLEACRTLGSARRTLAAG
jgi:fructose-bisphosphate aldolase class II